MMRLTIHHPAHTIETPAPAVPREGETGTIADDFREYFVSRVTWELHDDDGARYVLCPHIHLTAWPE